MILLKDRSVPLTAYSRLIGSPAAGVAIEHWMTPGHEPTPPFTAFEPGRIYVIEFWATWCPHCRAVFPLLASLQRQYARAGLTVIAVGREPPEAVQAFLDDADPRVRTAAEAARTCALATDPDGSVFRDYMESVAEIGLPTAFIIGRKGAVEWIGHPQDLEDPLRRVVEDRWDRPAFLEKTRKIEAVRRGVTAVEAPLRQGREAEAVAAYARFVGANDGDADALNEVAWLAWELAGLHPLPRSLLEAAVAAAGRSVDREPESGNFLDTLAHLQALQGDLDAAIATEKRAADHPGPFGGRIEAYLRELEAQKSAER
ncbi:MAG: hypothetical protein EBZ59_00425 [Planctomycetia bacterium]|nr:hypothetical protein [Planctomycetia bacterium]